MKKVLIMGGGLGGLFSGALLAKEGLEVTVVEKNAIIGGGLQCFQRFGVSFETGIHVVGGMQKGGNIRRICEFLGIMHKLQIEEVDENCADRIYVAEDDKWYHTAKGKQGFINALAEDFPEERQSIENYVEALYRLVEKVDQFHLRPTDVFTPSFAGEDLISADEFIAKHVSNERLQSVLSYMSPLYGGRRSKTPAYVHAIITVLYINGASRFVDGSLQLAEALAGVIIEKGGRVIKNDPVVSIATQNRHIQSIQTKKGLMLEADYYISDLHPVTLFGLMDEVSLPKAYRSRIKSIPDGTSAFCLYIKLKPETFPYINHSEFLVTRYADAWRSGLSDEYWPQGIFFMTPPTSKGEKYAQTVVVVAPMVFEEVHKWENTRSGDRGDDYKAWKSECAQKILSRIEKAYPGFSAGIEAMETSSPLTIRDFYATPGGSISGYEKDCKNQMLAYIPVATKVDNLFLTGQNIGLHGFCGVPLTAIRTCETILGNNHIINKLISKKDS